MKSLTDININAFAEAVRAELGDLTKSEIQELTDGLEADLAEKFAEEGVDFETASAAEYAAELREAAGVTAKPARRKAFSSTALMQNIQDWFRKTKFGTAILEFGISVRPVWWVLRAFVAWFIFAGVFYDFTRGAILLPVFIFISIQWGRKKWFTGKFFTALVLPLNLLALVLLLPAQGMLLIKLNNYANAEQMLRTMPGNDGLRYNGEVVSELKAFDAEGQEVVEPTFKDQRGNAIDLPATQVAYFSMPDIMGMNLYAATQALKTAGVLDGSGGLDTEYIDGATPEDGIVVEVYPPTPGDIVTKFDVIKITLGKK